MNKKYDISRYVELNQNDIIVVGCSGGPDSMALISMLLNVRNKYSLKLIVCHVNHNVRSESVIEAKYVSDFCHNNDIVYEEMTIEKYGDDNFENEARNIRYNFFSKIVDKYKAKYLMTAHHGDDLVETILMRMVRGSNLGGYLGFKKEVVMDNYKIVRPLINFTKDELVEYDKNNNIKYFIDSSNTNLNYTRNRYRSKVLPFLKKEDQNVHKKFLKFSEVLQDVNNYVKAYRDKALNDVYVDGKILIDKFLKLDSFIQKEIIYYLLQEFYQDDLILINDRHVLLITNAIKSKKSNIRVTLPNEVFGVKSYNYFNLVREVLLITEYEIEIGDFVKLPNNHIIKKVDSVLGNGNDICKLDSSEVNLPLIVRTRKIGDKIKLKGNGGTKKLKDIFIDSKIDIKKRDMWPVVVDSLGNIVWIPGLKKSKFDKQKSEKYDIILKYC